MSVVKKIRYKLRKMYNLIYCNTQQEELLKTRYIKSQLYTFTTRATTTHVLIGALLVVLVVSNSRNVNNKDIKC